MGVELIKMYYDMKIYTEHDLEIFKIAGWITENQKRELIEGRAVE